MKRFQLSPNQRKLLFRMIFRKFIMVAIYYFFFIILVYLCPHFFLPELVKCQASLFFTDCHPIKLFNFKIHL